MLALIETHTFSLKKSVPAKAKSIIREDLFLYAELVDPNVSDNEFEEIFKKLVTELENASQKDMSQLKKITIGKEFSSVTIGLLSRDSLSVKNIGGGEVLLEREGKIGKIASSGDIVSGGVLENDRVFVMGRTGIEHTSRERRYEIFSKTKTQKEELEEEIQFSSPSPHGFSLLVVKREESKQPRKIDRAKVKESLRMFWKRLKKVEEEELDPETIRKKKMFLTIAVILTGLLIASIFLNISQTQSTKRREKLAGVLDLVSHQYEEAVSLLELNPARSRTLLSDSKVALTPLLKEFPKDSKEYGEANEWLTKVSEQELLAYKIYTFTSVPLYFDISFIKAEGTGNKIASFETSKAILDTKNNTVYYFDSKTKKASVIAGGDTVKNAKGITIHGKFVYIVSDEGVSSVHIDTKKADIVIKRDEKWGDITALTAFGGNLYLLDRTNNSIWKYISQEVGYLPAQNYVNRGVSVNFSQAKELVIDGSVWVFSTGGDIVRLTQGNGNPFVPKDFPESMAGIEDISTSDTDTYVYFLDKQTSRIIVFDKDGLYHSQYQWDGLKSADDFIASEEEKKMFILSGNKIYAIDMK
ncbi:hypothetical protein HYW55_05755 [Candidatus Gottesmanbacteria bacterium]|nr:hypothetical protein [Candidatus Gottesmanbacteria bacterium]